MPGAYSIETSLKDHPINFKAYIAGQYAPAFEVQVQQGIFSFAEAQISLFPHRNLRKFGDGDRVPTQIFFLDTFNNSSKKDLTTPDTPEYRTLFDGEIVRTTYSRTPTSISYNISCVSNFEIFAQMLLSLYTDIVTYAQSVLNQTAGQATVGSPLAPNFFSGDFLLKDLVDSILLPTDASFKDLFDKDKILQIKSNDKDNIYLKRPFTMIRNILTTVINGREITDEIRRDVHLFYKTFFSKRNLYKSCFASPIVEQYPSPLKDGKTQCPVFEAAADCSLPSGTL